MSEAIGPLEIACDADIAKGCRYLSLIHWNSEPDRQPDSQKAEQYMAKQAISRQPLIYTSLEHVNWKMLKRVGC